MRRGHRVTTAIRAPRPADLDRLAAIEDAADRLLVDLLHPDGWGAAPSGRERATRPGFLLVADEEGRAVGFAHVLEVDARAHLEQLSVLPEHGRRGLGRALVAAALEEAARRGHTRVTLRTYADVPFNAPFYASCGFVESEPDSPFLAGLVEQERRLGLDRWGRRVQMTTEPVPRDGDRPR